MAGHPQGVQGVVAPTTSAILAGGVAYFAFLAIFPALIAGISLFGLVADPETIAQQAEGVLGGAAGDGPAAARATRSSR